MKRLLYLDVLKTLAILSIITTHTTANILFAKTLLPQWLYGAAFFDSLTRLGVPIFVMVSGALVLSKKDIDPLKFYKNALVRIIIPLMFWSILYYAYTIKFDFSAFNFTTYFIKFFTNKIYFHLWYLYMIFGIYLSAPFLFKIVVNSSKKELYIFLSLWFVIASLTPFISHFSGFKINWGTNIFISYIGYFILGYVLSTSNYKQIKNGYLWLLFVIITLIMTSSILYYKLEMNKYELLFIRTSSPFIIVQSIALFLLIKFHAEGWLNNFSRFFYIVGSLSLGIYILHIFARDALKNGYFGVKVTAWIVPYIGSFVNTIAIFLVTFFIVYLISKIPILRRTV